MIQEAYVHGASTRAVDDLVKAMGGTSVSKSHVSRLCSEIDEGVQAFLTRPIEGHWRTAMQAELRTETAKARYRKRQSTVEPVFGSLESDLGFTRFHLRGLAKVKLEWQLLTLAYNGKRLHRLMAA